MALSLKKKPAAKPADVKKPDASSGKSTAGRDKMGGKIATLFKEFVDNLPPDAASGSYHFTARDQWGGKKIGAFDGWYAKGEWAIRIKGGVPTEAVRKEIAHFPNKATRV